MPGISTAVNLLKRQTLSRAPHNSIGLPNQTPFSRLKGTQKQGEVFNFSPKIIKNKPLICGELPNNNFLSRREGLGQHDREWFLARETTKPGKTNKIYFNRGRYGRDDVNWLLLFTFLASHLPSPHSPTWRRTTHRMCFISQLYMNGCKVVATS